MSVRVVWITGYSGSGKTTVARKVEAALRAAGVSTVHLDGDDLRSILAGKWGYEREDRMELARSYFRLSSHLAAQQHTVIISAVAMYDDVREWMRSNIPGAIQVYLRVPESERRLRDAGSKRVYAQIGSSRDLYDEPRDADLVIDNFAEISADEAAARIVDYCETFESGGESDRGRRRHWADYYRNAAVPLRPSSFAEVVLGRIATNARVLEIGCGNGRDAVFFANAGRDVTALDVSAEAIELCTRNHAREGLRFLCGALPQLALDLPGEFDCAYSRFCLHAMTGGEEHDMLRAAQHALCDQGLFFIECRSINDPLARQGEVISPTERIHGHYRRFIVADELERRLLDSGFGIVDMLESNGLARLGDDDPVVIRVTARRETPT
ncbi:MAG: adenylyl-sulfate kinase [Pseudomonadales bacterium]|nr:adenylyl-sulfate kinase [Gammaproteobacteria bacterium]MBP6227056.1 adenylyl-sulfate kinase [Pseudomonadales bacterium]